MSPRFRRDIWRKPCRARCSHASHAPSAQLLAEAQRVAEASKHLNIFVTQTTELAHRAAEASDARRAAGQTRSSLDGVPIAVKVRAVGYDC